jgi:hypothetical protein
VFAEVRFAAGGAQFREVRVDLAERCENLSMRRPERIGIDSACRDERSSHIPITEHHAECCISPPAYYGD